MKDIDSLINELTLEAKPARPSSTLHRVIGVWVLGIAVYMIAVFALGLYHFRPDIMSKLSEPMFALEIIALICVLLSTICASATLSFPDLYQKPRWVYLPAVAFAFFVSILCLAWIESPLPNQFSFEGIECLICITLLSLAPAFFILYKMRRLATTEPRLACALAALCSFSVGALILRLSEDTDSMSHLVMWHYTPMLVIGLLGLWIGPKLLKW